MLNITLAKRRRRELGLTLREVGVLVGQEVGEPGGIGRDVIQRWEAGEREPRNTEWLRAYAKALQVSREELTAAPESETTEVAG
jgi:transcriptional regulator with XRE-family HTH domain